DVHRAARGEMADALALLRRARGVRAARHRLALGMVDVGAAHGTAIGEHVRLRLALPQLSHRADDARNHVAGADHDDDVADADVVRRDVLLIVQRGVRDRHAADADRLENGERVQRPGAADVDLDVEELRARFAGAELVGDRPARVFSDAPETLLQREIVDLHDDAVDLVVEPAALLFPARDVVDDAVHGSHTLRVRVHWEAQLPQPRQQIVLRRRRLVRVELADRIRVERKRPFRGRLRIELTDPAGRGVARIRERGGAAGLALGIEPREVALPHVGFTANVGVPRNRVRRAPQGERDRADRAQVRGDVFADAAVAARSARAQRPAVVAQRDGEPVDLQLARVRDGLALRDPAELL